jgi:hypothetical protein
LNDDATDYLNQHNRPGLLVTIDYFHAFDCISKDYMIEAFKFFGFGDTFLKWITVLMSNTTSCVNYCGWLSEPFAMESGIRQGCPFSPLAFVLALELLACRIRSNGGIKGFQFDGEANALRIIKILLYADDITLLLHDENDMITALQIFEEFSLISGLCINRKKSEAMWLGSRKSCQLQIADFKLKNTVKILGVYFSNKVCASELEENWKTRMDNCKRLIALWEKRNLSIMGKVCIVKTFLISQWVYIMQAILIPDKIIIEINRLLYRFLWRRKDSNKKAFEKVKRVILCSGIEQGGLAMIDLKDLQTSCLLNWAVNIFKYENDKWNYLAKLFFSTFGEKCICFHASVVTSKFKGLNNVKSLFWKAVLKAWLDNNIDNGAPTSQLLWNNRELTHQGNVLLFVDWIHGKILHVEDVLDDNRHILLYEDICNKIGYSPNRILEYNVVRSATASFLRKQENFASLDPALNLPTFCGKIISTIKGFREELVKNRFSTACAIGFWKRKMNFDVLPKVWTMAACSTQETRLRLLQWKIIHNIYATNIMLNKMKVTDTNKCSHCTDKVDFIEHFFFDCPLVFTFWKSVEQFILLHLDIAINLDLSMVLFGNFDNFIGMTDRLKVNHILLIAKMCISIYKKTKGIYSLNIIFEKNLRLRKFIN